ncbi:QueC-like queosine biosynthesis protein [Microbacterium phage Megan]|uniref:7-cyano-7-deazaguanine synthase n=1 Tax=Microbacterium phage Megan TaxID=2656551 RepID=A0A649VKM7_9CAUD|nr:QueC-like queosine biosynthesis protein [Microbacterium phage Megan]QGJ92675.1 QueC-like queosine biosynthesis protein [Microbacterium phage Megan]
MCSIFGRVGLDAEHFNSYPMPLGLASLSQARGRDSWGMRAHGREPHRVVGTLIDPESVEVTSWTRWVIGNTRAEPTTEWVPDKTADDVQPFIVGPLTVAHNGTIANDVALCERYGVDPHADGRSKIDTARWAAVAAERVHTPADVLDLLRETVGSYGIAVGHEDGWLVLATNYKPIWTRRIYGGNVIEFTSVAPRDQGYLTRLSDGWTMLDPYSALIVTDDGGVEHVTLREPVEAKRALVVCSGGLDSVVTAAWMEAAGYSVDLLHVAYGARAQERERIAVERVAKNRGYGLRHLDLSSTFAAIGHSRLTGSWEGAASGEEGAEYAIEWVPARNTILLGVAVGMAEAHGYQALALGNNLEESGAYPDNEQEFIGRFNDMLPFSVADGVDLRIIEPVGHLMKHEIVRLGLDLGAPLGLTWSCYDGGDMHCGDCGPCFMRKRGFEMAGALDPMEYAR